MANRTLMNPLLVVAHSGVKKLSIEQCSFQDIYTIEYQQARSCIGFDLWASMVAALVDYDSDETITEWEQEDAPYSNGEIVYHEGIYYVSLQDANEAQPGATAWWAPAPMFEGSCAEKYDELFCNHLAPYLANTILFKRLPYMDHVEYKDKKVLKSEPHEIQRVFNAVGNERAATWGNLVYYMATEDSRQLYDTCFAGWVGAQDEDCKVNNIKAPKTLRVGIYRFG